MVGFDTKDDVVVFSYRRRVVRTSIRSTAVRESPPPSPVVFQFVFPEPAKTSTLKCRLTARARVPAIRIGRAVGRSVDALAEVHAAGRPGPGDAFARRRVFQRVALYVGREKISTAHARTCSTRLFSLKTLSKRIFIFFVVKLK